MEVGRTELQLVVEREGGEESDMTVQYTTTPLAGMVKEGGIFLNPAVQGTDYKETKGTLRIAAGQVSTFDCYHLFWRCLRKMQFVVELMRCVAPFLHSDR